MTITARETSSEASEAPLLEMFRAPADPTPCTDHLFVGVARYIVQTPSARNDYKKKAGSSDGARTYDTTAV
jgi:hypothetical protein